MFVNIPYMEHWKSVFLVTFVVFGHGTSRHKWRDLQRSPLLTWKLRVMMVNRGGGWTTHVKNVSQIGSFPNSRDEFLKHVWNQHPGIHVNLFSEWSDRSSWKAWFRYSKASPPAAERSKQTWSSLAISRLVGSASDAKNMACSMVLITCTGGKSTSNKKSAWIQSLTLRLEHLSPKCQDVQVTQICMWCKGSPANQPKTRSIQVSIAKSVQISELNNL